MRKKSMLRSMRLKRGKPGVRKARAARRKQARRIKLPAGRMKKKLAAGRKRRLVRRSKRWRSRQLRARKKRIKMRSLQRKRRLKKLRDHSFRRAPNGFVSTVKEWLKGNYDEKRFKRYYQEHHPYDVTIVEESKGLAEPVHEHLRASLVKAQPCFTAVVKGARVWEKNGAVITPDNKLLADVSWDYSKRLVHGKDHNVFHKWRKLPLKRIEETSALLTFIWSGNYFHWMFDVLPRIELIRLSGIHIDRYVVPRDESKFQDETLNLLGIPGERRLEADHNFYAHFKRLVVPSFVRPVKDHPSEYPQWAVDFLRREFLLSRNVTPSGESEKIYISRARAWQRRLLNEDKVVEIMDAHGIKTVMTEEMSFMEQVRLFASARVIVAPHGAGLTNLAFCSPGTKVVELFAPTYVSNYYWHLSSQVRAEHYYLIGSGAVKPDEKWWEGSADFSVDPDRLELLLQKAGI